MGKWLRFVQLDYRAVPTHTGQYVPMMYSLTTRSLRHSIRLPNMTALEEKKKDEANDSKPTSGTRAVCLDGGT